MCGIVSIHSSGERLTRYEERLPAMLDALAHRGPDGRGLHHVPGSVLQGHVRLAIIDPEHGQQPMVTRDGRFSIVFNGAIYNYVELRRGLESRGVRFSTSSDTEVLLQALVIDGTRAIPELNGMYAFVFHDRDTGRWIAARDPFGIKPLYVSRLGTELVFASEIKAILASGFRARRVDMAALAQYVAFQFALGRRTMFEGVERVPPATWLEGHGADILREHRFWQPNQEIDIESEQQAVELVRSILDDTMRLQLRADVPVGSSLSGGLDSSVVCSLASQQRGAPLPAFHGRFDAGRSFDEWPYADALARSIGTELRVVTPTPNDFVAAMPEIIRLLDEPVAGPGSFPQFMVSRTASSEVKVMLGGQGGDEIFGGYARYLIAYLEQALKGAITGTQEEGKHIVTLENVVPQLRVLETYFPLMREFWSKGLFDDMNRRYFALIDRSRGVVELLHPEVRSELDFDAVFDEYAMIFADAPTPSYINKMLGFDMVTLLPALLQVEDRMSMGASLESRVPFLDTRLVDALGRISPGIKFTAGVGKHVLRLAADGLLPPVVAERTDKMGFPVPLVEWMDHPAVDEFVRDTILTSTGHHRTLVDGTAARRLLDDGTYTNRQLWGLLSLQLWNQTFIDA